MRRGMRLAVLGAVLALASSASANFSFDGVKPGRSGGFEFSYAWSGVTAGVPPYVQNPPTFDFVGQVIEGIKGIAPGSTLTNYDPLHFSVGIYLDFGDTYTVFVQPTPVAYTSGTREVLFSVIDNYDGVASLPGYYDVSGVSHAINQPVPGPSGVGNYSAAVPEPGSLALAGIAIIAAIPALVARKMRGKATA
jgi:hypothetical protein